MVYKEMNNIVKECNEVCQMGILDGADVLYINKRRRRHKPYNWFHILGLVCLLSILALGKAIICEYSDQQIRQLYPDGFVPMTSYSVTTLEQLRQQLEDAERNGYAFDNREINEETVCYAVALNSEIKRLPPSAFQYPYFVRQRKNCRCHAYPAECTFAY